MKNAKMLAISVLLLVLTIASTSNGESKMYWTEAGTSKKIKRANLDGTGVEDLVTGLERLGGIALDIGSRKMYWTEKGTTHKIKRANVDGTGVEDLVTGLQYPCGIALDTPAGKMYWSEAGRDGKIRRSNLDGSGVEDLVPGVNESFGIALDIVGGKMYWTSEGAGKIQRANLDGSGVEDLVTGLDMPSAIALDIGGGKMYWSVTSWPGMIQRANLDGTGVEDLVTVLEEPFGIALDTLAGKMYWTAAGTADKIQRANLDGTGVEDLVTGLENLYAIALAITMTVQPMGAAFTYQGSLNDAGSPADGLYDFQFKLYNANVAGMQEGNTIDINDLDVIEGQFTLELDFGSDVFAGDARWLEIGVRPGDSNDPNALVTLSPRIEITPVPYALHTRGVFLGPVNTFVGIGAGRSNTTGRYNTFLGRNAGYSNTAGPYNTFLGEDAGYSNTEGFYNTFLGNTAGYNNTTGSRNTFSGYYAGIYNTTGTGNVFIGYKAGYNETGSNKLYIANSSADPPLIYGDFATGKVGIGTTDPSEELEVNGTAKATAFVGDGSGLTNLPAIPDSDWIISDSHMYSGVSGNVGIGTTSPDEKLTVVTSKWTGKAVYGQAAYNGGVTNFGGYFLASGGTGRGVYGEATHSSGIRTNYGGYFKAAGYYGRGVYGEASGSSGEGVYGYASNAGDVANQGGAFVSEGAYGGGVFGQARGRGGKGVQGHASNEGAVTNYGGYFSAAGLYGRGVCGEAINSGDVTNYGGYFKAWGSNGRGIFARGGYEGYAAEFHGNVLIRDRGDNTTLMELGEGLDYAEGFDVSDKSEVAGGTVLVIDSENPGKLAISSQAYDSKVAGIVAGAKGQGSGVRLGADEFDYDVALAGRVYCNVDSTEAGVEPGDLLTTSATPGYAMKAADYMRAQGAILGKAMESLEKGKKGQILVLVTLQ